MRRKSRGLNIAAGFPNGEQFLAATGIALAIV